MSGVVLVLRVVLVLQTVKQEVEAEDSDGEEAEDQGLVDEMVRPLGLSLMRYCSGPAGTSQIMLLL